MIHRLLAHEVTQLLRLNPGPPGVCLAMQKVANAVDEELKDLLGRIQGLRSQLPRASRLTVGALSANAIEVTIQGAKPVGRRTARLWLADTQFGEPTGAAPSGGLAVDTGSVLETIAPDVHLVVLSDDSGRVVVTVTEPSARSLWLMASAGDLPAAVELVFT
jgi:hypothetical protein